MTEIILSPIVELILGKLGSFASDQVRLLWNLKPEILKLGETVAAIQAVLLDAEKKQSHNHQVKLWLKRISDVMHDADDLLDDFSTEGALQKQALTRRRAAGVSATCWSSVRSPVSSLPQRLMYDFKMARDIKSIREKLDAISKDKEAFMLEVGTEGKSLPSFRETDACPPTIVIGRDDDKKEIIELLLNCYPEANISVVPIVGMGGMGKTTLAQLVYDDDQVQDHFDIKAWVYVSQSFDVKMILLNMLESITRQKAGDLTSDNLQAQLRGEIKGKRFLFVLDDVWEESRGSWENLGNYLAVGAPGSKVLVTTRSTRVADLSGGALKSRTCTAIVESYHLKGLSEDESWKLLKEKSLPRQVPAEVQDIGKRILKQCRGVPLAVSTIAGVLADSTDPQLEWPFFLPKDLSSIRNEDEQVSIMDTLQVSFNHLPSRMKHCFSYCGLFEKGFLFKIPMLVRLWVAQGYVVSDDKAYDCFKTLWWRSFFQEVTLDGLGNLSTCRMHDLMHDLIDSMAGENIRRSSSSSILKNVSSKARHLCITRGGNDNLRHEDCGAGGELGSTSKVRTLISFKPLLHEELERVLNNFVCLRVLVIVAQSSYDENDYMSLNLVGNLKHLRYLGMLGFTKLKTLPASIVNLVNLQVLNLIGDCSLEELPRDIKKLANLKHLDLDQKSWANLTCVPKGIGELKFLHTLSIFVVGKRSGCTCSGNDVMVGAGLDELKGLTALCGELTIKGLGNVHSPKKGVHVFKEMLHLQSLVLDWRRDDDNNDGDDAHDEGILEMLWPHPNLKTLTIYAYEGEKLPSWLSSLTNLVEFSLHDCKRCEYLPPLHELPRLRELTIQDCPKLKGCWWKKVKGNDDSNNDHHGGSDDYYYFDSSMEREEEKKEDEETEEWPHFPCLSTLQIEDCPKLTRIPLFPTVEGSLWLESCSAEALVRTMRMKPVVAAHHHHLDSQQNSSFTTLLMGTALVSPLSKVMYLTLYNMDELESLPEEGLRNLTSLQRLSIYTCPRLASLPPTMRELTSLQELYIHQCPLLTERCRRGEGEDWPTISHIPNILLD